MALRLCLLLAAAPIALQAQDTAADAPLRAELQQARRQLDGLQSLPPPQREGQADRLRALNRQVALLGARIDALSSPDDTSVPPRPAALVGAAPYAAAQVDRLRDQLDSLEAQRAALQPLLASLSTDRQEAAAMLRKAAETLRLRREQGERARDDAAARRAQDDLELAKLEHRVAELELERVDRALLQTQARLGALEDPARQLAARVGTGRAAQRMDDDELAAVQREAQKQRRVIAARRAEVDAELRNARLDGAAPDSAALRKARWDRDALASLSELDAVVAARGAVWQQRQSALAAQGSDTARTAAAGELQRSIHQANAHERGIDERLELMRSELRLQRARIEAAAGDAARQAAERRALDSLQRRLEVDDELRGELARVAVLLERSRSDLEVAAARPSSQDLLARLRTGTVALLAAVWDYELFSAPETLVVEGRPVTIDYGVTVGKSIGVVLLFGVGWWLAARLCRRLIDALVRHGTIGDAHGRVLYRWVMTALLLVVLWAVLKLARIPLTAFAFLGGALAIGIGFGAQNLLKNLMSGVIILFERKVRVGDIVTVGGVTGTVGAIDLRATTVRSFDGIQQILPNSYLLENLVGDWSQSPGGLRTEILVPAAYGTDSAAAAALILECAGSHPQVLASPVPEVLLDDFATHGLVFRLWIWTALTGRRAAPLVASDLRFAIDRAFTTHGIAPPVARHSVEIGSTAGA
jgi:small-conductance mechanosensitive channel